MEKMYFEAKIIWAPISTSTACAPAAVKTSAISAKTNLFIFVMLYGLLIDWSHHFNPHAESGDDAIEGAYAWGDDTILDFRDVRLGGLSA